MYLVIAFFFGVCFLSFIGILFFLFVAHNRRQLAKARFSVDSENRNNIRFDFLGTEVHLWVDSTGMYGIELEWHDPRHRIDARLRRFSHEGIRRFGMEKVDLSDPELARHFLIYANIDPGTVREVFAGPVPKRLFDLANYFGQSQFQLAIYSHKFVVKKRLDRNLGGKSKDLVRLAIQLRNSLAKALENSKDLADAPDLDGDITFLDVRDATLDSIEETECQVCGQKLEKNLVACKSCKTLHHKDCWEYNGRCSTFGCLQRKYRRHKNVRK